METDEPKKSTTKSAAGKKAETELPRLLDQLDRLTEEEKQKVIQALLDRLTEEEKQKVIQALLGLPEEEKQKMIRAIPNRLSEEEKPKVIQALLGLPEEERKETVQNYLAMALANDKKRIFTTNFLGISLFLLIGFAIWNGHQWTAAILGVAGASTAMWRRK